MVLKTASATATITTPMRPPTNPYMIPSLLWHCLASVIFVEVEFGSFAVVVSPPLQEISHLVVYDCKGSGIEKKKFFFKF